MGISPSDAKAIIREHAYRPITGDVVVLGRQTMFFTPADAAKMMLENSVTPAATAASQDRTVAGAGQDFVTDDTFFRMLGVPRVIGLDHSDYEGAELIHDLNAPLPASMEGVADFILDGSTLDNLWAPSTALQSMARMLRPGGRLIAANAGSPFQTAASIFSPYWFLNYFAINQWLDCRVYLKVMASRGWSVITVNPWAQVDPPLPVGFPCSVVAFAEKGPDSTWDRLPTQRYYASPETHAEYRVAAERFWNSGRPHLMRSDIDTFPPLSPWSMLRQGWDGIGETLGAVRDSLRVVDPKGNERLLTPPWWARFTPWRQRAL